METDRLLEQIQENQTVMCALNKQIRGERLPNEQPMTLNVNLVSTVSDQNTKVQGIDPWIVTMATGVSITTQRLLNNVNCFQALMNNNMAQHLKDECLPFALIAKIVNSVVGSNVDRKKMEKKKPS